MKGNKEKKRMEEVVQVVKKKGRVSSLVCLCVCLFVCQWCCYFARSENNKTRYMCVCVWEGETKGLKSERKVVFGCAEKVVETRKEKKRKEKQDKNAVL